MFESPKLLLPFICLLLLLVLDSCINCCIGKAGDVSSTAPLSSCHQAPPSSPNRIRSLFPDVSATLQSEGEGSLAASAAAGISVCDDGEWWLLEKFVFALLSFIKMAAWSYALAAALAVSNVPSQILLFLLGVHVPQPHDIRFKCVCSTRSLGFRQPFCFQLR
ncbi:hypothetical protein L1987_34439 [Smallanthus sonchifolius]|uniref:Uncharacterized protein n=1 Tax=Smallanthus sonchifolius TaxID=185202 RepID=A0ACB9HTA6_9ASTR|nr:hypothetical protein L1987_34439 [Smallanthus sonchifolius]